MRQRLIAILTLVPVLGNCGAGQDPSAPGYSPKVTASYPGISLSRLLAALSTKTGAHLQADPGIGDSIVALKVADVPLNDILARLAQTTGGEWRTESTGSVIGRSVQAERVNAAACLKRRTESLQKSLTELGKTSHVESAWGSTEAGTLARDVESAMGGLATKGWPSNATLLSFMSRSPGSRALAKLMLQIGPAGLATDFDGKRHVYALHPNARQKPLPSGCAAIIDNFIREQVQFDNALTANRATQPPSNGKYYVMGLTRSLLEPGNPGAGVGQALLSVRERPDLSGADIVFTVADSAGAIIFKTSTVLGPPAEPPKKFDPLPDEHPLVPPGMATEFIDAIRAPSGSTRRGEFVVNTPGGMKRLSVPGEAIRRQTPPSPALLDLVLHPDTDEPLAISTGTDLVQAADGRRLNLIANLSDRLFPIGLGRKEKPSAFLGSPKLQNLCEISTADGWLIVQPLDLDQVRRDRVNRAALAKMLASVRTKKLLMLDDLAQFAMSQAKPMAENDIDFGYLRVVNPSASDRTYVPENWNGYRVYGSLTPGQRDTLASSGSVPLRNLSPLAFASLEDMVYEKACPPILTAPDGSRIEPNMGTVINDWTQFLPNGVPGQGALTAKIGRAPAAYCFDSSTGTARIISNQSLAEERFLQENPTFSGQNSTMPHDLFAPATMWHYDFELQFSPNIGTAQSLDDGKFDNVAQLVPFDALPSAFKDSIDKQLVELREVFGKADWRPVPTNANPPTLMGLTPWSR